VKEITKHPPGSGGDGIQTANARWSFHGDTADKFDAHIGKSVPFYQQGQELVCDISDYFLRGDSLCYELGCSTGNLLLKLADHHAGKPGCRFIGFDIEPDMIRLAQRKLRDYGGGHQIAFEVADAQTVNLQACDLIVAYYTLQFIHPSQRQALCARLYRALTPGGALVLFEKVRANDARFQDMSSGLYQEYKLKQGYSPEEILTKARSLKGVLEPFSAAGNRDLLRQAGFQDICCLYKYICFAGWIAIK
jgi:tRNA (cmo5U34)-methyltransferase